MPRQPRRDALARERGRRSKQDGPSSTRTPASPATTRRAAAATCGWCGGAIDIKATGRIPKWCSPACRQRAWEQSRAAASGRSAVEVVERVVERVVEVSGTDGHERTPRRGEWPPVLRELANQLDAGRIYVRDLPELQNALAQVIAALQRRENARRPRR